MEPAKIMKPARLLAVAGALLLGACGSDPGERALSGAGLGAATGAVGGALFGNPAAGAALGGAAGALAGGLTNRSQIDLGRPIWRR